MSAYLSHEEETTPNNKEKTKLVKSEDTNESSATNSKAASEQNVYGEIDGVPVRVEKQSGGYFCGLIQSRSLATRLAMGIAVLFSIGVGLAAYFIVETVSSEEQHTSNHDDHSVCDSAFGMVCGCTGNVPAYSNCNSYYASMEDNFIEVQVPDAFTSIAFLPTNANHQESARHLVKNDAIVRSSSSSSSSALPSLSLNAGDNNKTIVVYTGMKYQCVEYSRRFLIESTVLGKYVTFGSIDGASNIFDLPNVTSVFNSTNTFEFISILNDGDNNSAPQFGDLFIYPIQGTEDDFPFGHVAIVAFVDTDRKVVGVAEQNWANAMWPMSGGCGAANMASQNAREISLVYNETRKAYRMVDEKYIIRGWKRVGGVIQ